MGEADLLELAARGVRSFRRRYAGPLRLSRLDPDHFLWPAYRRVERMHARGRFDGLPPAGVLRLATTAGVLACVDELRMATGVKPGRVRRSGRLVLTVGLAWRSTYNAGPAAMLEPHAPPVVAPDDADELAAALRRTPLSDRQRQALWLHVGLGLTLEEAGGRLGVGPNACWVACRVGLRRVRDRLTGRPHVVRREATRRSPPPDPGYAAAVKAARTAAGHTLRAAAALCGVSVSGWHHCEAGRAFPRPAFRAAVRRVYGVAAATDAA